MPTPEHTPPHDPERGPSERATAPGDPQPAGAVPAPGDHSHTPHPGLGRPAGAVPTPGDRAPAGSGAPTPADVAQARAMLRRHGLNLEGACWWCGRDQPYPCPTYLHAQAVLAAAQTAEGHRRPEADPA